jgi:hypothetical protein
MPVTASSPATEQEDLSSVLDNIGWGKLATTRAKLANTLATREFLEIGLGLLRDDLLRHTGPDFDHGDRSRLFESLSRERIMQRAAEMDPDEEKCFTVNMFRHRWDRKDRYTEDLISYLFRQGPPLKHMEDMVTAAEEMLAGASLKELIHALAAVEVDTMLNDPTVSLQTIVQTAMPNHPRVQHFIQAQNDLLLPSWAKLYEQVAAAYGLTLKAGFTWLDVALLFNAVVEGALVRARIDQAEPVLSNGEGILASAILAMLPTLIEGIPDDCGSLYSTAATKQMD